MIHITMPSRQKKEEAQAMMMLMVTTVGRVTLMVVSAPTPFMPQELAMAYRLWWQASRMAVTMTGSFLYWGRVSVTKDIMAS